MWFHEFIITNEVPIRLGFFFGVFALMAIWEMLAPKRILTFSKTYRWANNLGLVFFNSFILRFLFPGAAIGVAVFVNEKGWGLLSYYKLPFTVSVIIGLIAMDFIIYFQHVMVHAIPILWRLHIVHHTDLDYDVTTGARFHTIEIILSMLIKFASIVVLGCPVIVVLVFEVILNALSMFNHGNVGLPKALDSFLRWFVVTPDMHRVHHSIEADETNSNFGFNLSWWDRLFGTYRNQPRGGHEDMTIGIHKFREPKQVVSITGMLRLPFDRKIGNYTLRVKKRQ
jgi:sterol desaturase/sphingolipid hydroxylase (fatty acid hydroxylase superfamily)